MFILLPFIEVLITRFGTGIKKWVIYALSVVVSCIVPQLTYLSVFVLGMCFRAVAKNTGSMVNQLNRINVEIISILSILLLDIEYIMTALRIECPEVLTINITAFGTVLLMLSISKMNNIGYIFRIFSFLGDLSYEFYLIHFVVLMWMRFSISYIGIVLYGISSLLISVLFAYGLMHIGKKIKRFLLQRSWL